MRKISSKLMRLTLEILCNVLRNIITAVERSNIEGILEMPAFLAIRDMYERLFAVIYKKTKSGMGKDAKEQSLRCDESFSSFKKALQAYAGKNSEQGYASAAILEYVNEASPISKKKYGGKVERLSKLMTDLESTKNQALIEITGAQSLYDDLKEDTKTFISLLAEQRDADSDLSQKASGTSFKREVVDVLETFLAVLYGHRKDPGWSDLYSDVFQITENARQTIPSGKKNESAS